MRLNRGTLILLLASLAVIAVVLVLSNNQASAPGAETTTPSAFSTASAIGPLLPDLDQGGVARVEVTDNQTGASTVLGKIGDETWTIASATFSTDRDVDQAAAAKAVTDLVGLQANDSFESDKLADFGLTEPAYVITLTNADGLQHIIYVGNKNPAGNRYYLLVATAEATPVPTTEATAEATSEATSEATPEPYESVTPGVTSGTVYLVLQSSVAAITDLISKPPYVPAPTATPTPTATLNPLSEVEQATQTAEFFASVTAVFEQVQMTQTAEATLEATAEATPELTDTPTPG
jgi:hypothetical protein